jgi:hypothetical protein
MLGKDFISEKHYLTEENTSGYQLQWGSKNRTPEYCIHLNTEHVRVRNLSHWNHFEMARIPNKLFRFRAIQSNSEQVVRISSHSFKFEPFPVRFMSHGSNSEPFQNRMRFDHLRTGHVR